MVSTRLSEPLSERTLSAGMSQSDILNYFSSVRCDIEDSNSIFDITLSREICVSSNIQLQKVNRYTFFIRKEVKKEVSPSLVLAEKIRDY